MTLGAKPRGRVAASTAGFGCMDSGRRMISMARARLGSRLMKPRSSKALIRR